MHVAADGQSMDGSALTGLTLATLGLLATGAGFSVWIHELSTGSLVWLTGRSGSPPAIAPQRMALLLGGPGIIVQFCGALVAARSEYDTISISAVAVAWLIAAGAATMIRSSS